MRMKGWSLKTTVDPKGHPSSSNRGESVVERAARIAVEVEGEAGRRGGLAAGSVGRVPSMGPQSAAGRGKAPA